MVSSQSILERFKPASNPRGRLLLAATMWSAVGMGLAVAGARWLLQWHSRWGLLAAASAVAVGLGKGALILAPRARANDARIRAAGDHRCLGGVFPWSAWGLVLVMIALGVLLRHSSLPRPWLGALYLAIGTALLSASLVFWSAWRHTREGRQGPGDR